MDSCGRTGWTRWTLLADRQPRKQIVIATVRSLCKATHWYQVAAYLLQNVSCPGSTPLTFGPVPIPSMCAHVSFGTQRKNDKWNIYRGFLRSFSCQGKAQRDGVSVGTSQNFPGNGWRPSSSERPVLWRVTHGRLSRADDGTEGTCY